jgi:hypothetical protein
MADSGLFGYKAGRLKIFHFYIFISSNILFTLEKKACQGSENNSQIAWLLSVW